MIWPNNYGLRTVLGHFFVRYITGNITAHLEVGRAFETGLFEYFSIAKYSVSPETLATSLSYALFVFLSGESYKCWKQRLLFQKLQLALRTSQRELWNKQIQ